METPICDFVKAYSEKNAVRLHMPGHKGENISGTESFDITEINGADVLYNDNGIIKKSRENASLLFGSGKTLYSAEGSSLSIRAMLYMTLCYAKKMGIKPIIAAGRNAHKSFVTAAALLDIEVEWIYPEEIESLVSCKISSEYLDKQIEKLENKNRKPVAVYVTSPDYLGNISDISGFSRVCKSKNILLITDNAHGAYLNFLEKSLHPIGLGADICCDSAHKTLPVLTGGGYLHIAKTAPKELFEYAENAMAIFASTSPSYIILQSLDRANKYMAEEYKNKLSFFCQKVKKLKCKLKEMGFALVGDEPLKITISTKPYGYYGTELADILEKQNIICEFSDSDYLVMMLSANNREDTAEIIEEAFGNIKKRSPITTSVPILSKPVKRMSLREAIVKPGKWMNTEDCLGKILLSPSVNCPPAVSVVVCGEEIDEKAIELLKYYGIDKCYVDNE